MLNTARVAKLKSWIGQMEELFRAIEDVQYHDIPKLVDKVRESECMTSQVVTIENFLGLYREIASVSAEGSLGDMVRHLKAELTDVKA